MRAQLPSRLFALACAGASLVSTPAAAQTHVFTVDADFDTGTLNHVAHNPSNQLQLGPTAVSQTHNVWVDNYIPGWIVRIDSNTGKQTARFDTALQFINGQPTGARPSMEMCNGSNAGNCPRRVAVDTNGDVWIPNAAFGTQGSLSKFSGDIGHCIDRNNNGVIDTSRDANNDGIVNPADPAEYLGPNDECILTTLKVGGVNHIPRAVAVDKKGKVWVGTYNGQTLYRYNPNEPVTLEATVSLPGACPYSMAAGGDYVFVSNRCSGGTKRVHIDTLVVETAPCSSNTYGVVGDPAGGWAWLGGYGEAAIRKADFTKNPPTCTSYAAPAAVTAMTIDLQNNIWASGYGNGQVFKYSPAGVLLGQYATGGAGPHGLSVDFLGNIWSVQDGAPNLVKFSPAGTNLGSFSISATPAYNYTPYLYSDFTGVQIDRIAPYTRVGIWEGTYDGGANAIPWSNVTWNTEPQGAVPTETTLKVSARAADTPAELATAPYAPCQNGTPMVGIKGRYVQVKVDFQGPGYKTPVLADVAAHGPCGNVGEMCCVKDPDCNDSKPCTLDQCPVPGGVCMHSPIPDCCQLDPDCNDSNACTVDTCVSGTCQHAKQAGCCMANQDCDDGLPCTADLCSGLGGTCSNVAINGCCMNDLDCTKGNPCSDSKCPAPGGLCDIKYKAGCCQTDSDCTDTDLCTTDLCDTANNTCSNTQIVGCCNLDNQCYDGNECTTDTCSGPGGICQFVPKAKCCTPTDPEVGQPCDFPVSPNDHPPCAPGHLVCENNDLVCKDAKKPDPKEKCDWLDNNCDGNIDENSCPTGTTCINGICAKPCGTPEFPCDAGFVCKNGVCLPIDCTNVICAPGLTCSYGDCVNGDGGVGGSAGNAGAGGTAGADGGVLDGAAGNPDSGKGGAGASAGGGQGGAGAKAGGSGAAGTTGASGNGQSEPDKWGMTTGGGGCKCSAPGQSSPSKMAMVAIAGLAIAVAARRKRPRK